MPRPAVSLARLMPAPDPGPPDAQLLRAFVAARGEDTFAEIVRRHGPMVLAACRRVLGHADDAEDAFQATFLVLARKAATIRGANLAGWLYAVAVRTARGVRIMRDRRRSRGSHESGDGRREVLVRSSRSPTPDAGLLTTELSAVIDEELARLPECYREAMVLCELRGLSRKEAAAELGIPEGTLSSRLATAKRKLAARLSARGLSAPAALAAVLAPASVSSALVRSAVGAAHGVAAPLAGAAASAVVKAMLFDQLKAVALAAGLLLTVACGSWAMTGVPGGDDPAPAPRAAEDPAVKLVAQLGAAEFADREAAQKELRKLGTKAEPALKAALKSENPEVRDRAAKVLAEVRADAREALAKNFKADGTDDPDHPLWKRFQKVVGRDKSARHLFARLIADSRRLQLLDDAERDPDKVGELYAREAINLYKGVVPRQNRPWQDAVVAYLGTYPATAGRLKDRAAGDDREEKEIENTIHHSLHLVDIVQTMRPELFDDVVRPPAGTAEEFIWKGSVRLGPNDLIARESLVHAQEVRAAAPALKRLLPAWYEFRDPALSDGGLQRALFHDPPITELLPLARRVAADAKRPAKSRCVALPMIVRFGEPADVRRFADLFADDTVLTRWENKESMSIPGVPADSAVVQVRDFGLGMALMLHDQDPFEFGFPLAQNRYPRKNGRFTPTPAIDDPFLGFPDDKSRAAAHAKAEAFLAGQQKKEPNPDPAARKLVEQLGAQEFADREAAEKALRELGPKARAAVLAGLTSENPEVVRRCRAVLAHIRREEVKAAFLKAAGDDDSARVVLEEVLKDAHRAGVLDEAVQHPERSGKLYAAEQWRLWQNAVSTPPGAKEADIPTAPEIALSFVLGAHASSADALKTEPPPDDPRITEGRRAVESDLLCKSLQLELIDPKRRGPFARLMAGWAAARSDPWVVSLALGQARQYRLPELVPVARQVVGGAKLDARHRAVAALALADLGGRAELPALRGLVGDKTECGRFREGPNPDGPTLTVQLRDVAVGATLLLSGQDPGEFGFLEFRRAGVAELKLPEKLNDRWFAFASDTDRKAAHEKARAWLDRQKKVEPKQEEPTPGLLRDLDELDGMRRGEQTDFAAVEKRGGELLAKYPAAADRGRIYCTLTRVYSNSGIDRTFARVTKYGRLALEHEKNPVARGQVFSYLASAAEVAVAADDPLADDPFAVKRKRSADIILEGYRELLPLKLPAVAPELPGVEKIGGLLDGADPAEEARIRERHAAQLKARREAEFVREMVHRRDTYAVQLKYLYGRDPKADDELRKVVEGTLKDPKAAADLLDQVAKSR